MPLSWLSWTTQIPSSRKIYRGDSETERLLTDLSVGYADEPLVHQFVCFGVPGLSLHDVALSCFVSQGDGRDLGDKKGEKISKLCTEIHKEISKSVEKSAPCQFPGRYTGW